MPQSYCNLLYHMVFSTKHREPTITVEIKDRICAYLGGAIKGENGVPILINGMEDHVHILAALHQDCKVSDVLRNIKANSSKWLHRDVGPQRFSVAGRLRRIHRECKNLSILHGALRNKHEKYP